MRRSLSLNGTWSYAPLARVTITGDGTWKSDKSNLPERGEMVVPSHWERNGLTDFFGTVRFERTFTAPAVADGDSVWLVFRGVDYFAKVYLNGQPVGEHEGYFQTWDIDITSYVHAGENQLAVDVTSPLEEQDSVWCDRKRMIKGILSHWDARPGSWDPGTGQDVHSGGIWNDVEIEVRPAAFIKQIRTQTRLTPPGKTLGQNIFEHKEIQYTPDELQARVLISTELQVKHNLPSGQPVELEIHLGEHVARTPVNLSILHATTIETMITIEQPQLWWTWDHGEPYLYTCSVRLFSGDQLIDEHEQPVGVREITVTPEGEWMLNHRRIFIRGTNIIPTLWLAEYTDERIAQDIDLVRQAHLNAVRVCVHVNREELYTALDHAGILIWQDFALQWGYQQNDAFIAEAMRQIKDMVRQFRHHPGIALWCCQNESTQFNREILDPILALAAREEDSSRYVRPTSEFDEHPYPGWYYGKIEDFYSLKINPIITEFGAQALPSVAEMHEMVGETWPPDWKKMFYHDFQHEQTFHVAKIPMGENWDEFVTHSQEYQARLLKTAIEHYRLAKYAPLGCYFQFMFMDCWPSVTWSIISHDRRPKAGFFAVQQASQPVLAGVEMRRDVWTYYHDGKDENWTTGIKAWIVNDLPQSFDNARLLFAFKSDNIEEVELESIPCSISADSVANLSSVQLRIPLSLPDGSYTLSLRLEADGKVISSNSYPVTIAVYDAQSYRP